MYYGNRPTVQPTVNTTPEYQTENVVLPKMEVLVDFAVAIQKGKKKNPPAHFLQSLPHSTHSIHGITAATATVTTKPKKYTKTTITVSSRLCPKIHASKALLKFREPWLSHDQSGGIEFSC